LKLGTCDHTLIKADYSCKKINLYSAPFKYFWDAFSWESSKILRLNQIVSKIHVLELATEISTQIHTRK
jgi:hypothetical protein